MPAPSSQSPVSSQRPREEGGKRNWLMIAIVLLAAAGGGGWWWQQQQAQAATPAAPQAESPVRAAAQYFAIEPAFVVNLADENEVRYLQADVQLVTRDPATLAAFETHAPAIRNRLLLLFGQQSSVRLAQRSGKERLQEAALSEVRQLLKAEGAPDKVEAAIFTSMVTQ
ncbi:flagellar basal body-associated FliL family protein [Lysobacter sp. TAF61]|uniref:flagellar basal body-associated FliL family protein n=1 Tax=Lysobacter sp. TAF61 TaxID=3233072 RepID=UPI003F955F8A